jgi:hypothetical protein
VLGGSAARCSVPIGHPLSRPRNRWGVAPGGDGGAGGWADLPESGRHRPPDQGRDGDGGRRMRCCWCRSYYASGLARFVVRPPESGLHPWDDYTNPAHQGEWDRSKGPKQAVDETSEKV